MIVFGKEGNEVASALKRGFALQSLDDRLFMQVLLLLDVFRSARHGRFLRGLLEEVVAVIPGVEKGVAEVVGKRRVLLLREKNLVACGLPDERHHLVDEIAAALVDLHSALKEFTVTDLDVIDLPELVGVFKRDVLHDIHRLDALLVGAVDHDPPDGLFGI